MGDHGDLSLGGPFYKSSSEGGVIENAERDLNGRDVGELERLIQLATVDIGDSNVPHHAFVEQPRQRAHRRSPRRSRIGSMDEVKVDRQSVQRSEARFTVGENDAGATIGDPRVAGSRHAALRHDARVVLRATAAKRAGQQSFVVS